MGGNSNDGTHRFVALLRKRLPIGLRLSAAMIFVYFGLLAFHKPLLGTILAPGLSVCMLSIVWQRLTIPATAASILVGTVSSLLLIYLSPTVQVDAFGKTLAQIADAWWFVPLRNPAIVCMPLSFLVAVVISLVT